MRIKGDGHMIDININALIGNVLFIIISLGVAGIGIYIQLRRGIYHISKKAGMMNIVAYLLMKFAAWGIVDPAYLGEDLFLSIFLLLSIILDGLLLFTISFWIGIYQKRQIILLLIILLGWLFISVTHTSYDIFFILLILVLFRTNPEDSQWSHFNKLRHKTNI